MDLTTVLLEQEDYLLGRQKTAFKKNNILTINDLFLSYPTRYENFIPSSLAKAKLEENIVLEGSIISKITINYVRTKLTTLSFLVDVDGKVIKATIFNRIFLKNKLDYGMLIRLSGRFNQNFNNFTVNELIICDEIDRDIVPIYNVKDISETKYVEIIEKVFQRYEEDIVETLPTKYRTKYLLPTLADTIRMLHLPDSPQDIEQGRERIKYEELLQYQFSMKYLHYMREKYGQTKPIEYDEHLLDLLKAKLEYQLTADQEKAVAEILKDLQAPYPMNRLLQGEVGSGKTIVAIMAVLAVVSGGYQAAFMCPTEILSQQHFVTLNELLGDLPIKIAILTGSTPLKNRKQVLEGLKDGSINIVVGTHALFQEDVEYQSLGIVIADEEHRFGVRQRVLIRNKGHDVNYLKMSATPIPRTLAISAYGDTDISIIKTMPINRKPVITKYVDSSEKRLVIDHMKRELAVGHQIYVVTPLINESEALDSANATEIYENMQKYFKSITEVGLIHGRLKASEKEEIMQKFLDKQIGILVATSVIEVGVNVANATTIVILGSERFGVATLHQLRGRVMRSSAVPYCFLLAEKSTELSEKRLKLVENNADGFALAEYDLINRGPGEFFGEKQSGSLNFKYADLRVDQKILENANSDSEEIINNPNSFNNPEYQELFRIAESNYHMKLEEID